MSITFDTSTGYSAGFVGSGSFSHTVGSSSGNRYLIVAVALSNSAGTTVTGVTYNGVAMTQLATFTNDLDSLSGLAHNEYIFGLAAPSTGSNTVAISISANARITAIASSYYGVNATGQPDSSNTVSNHVAPGPNPTIAVTTVTNNDWIVGFFVGGNTGITYGAGSNTTIRTSQGDIGGSLSLALTDSNADQTPAGSFSQTVSTLGLSNHWGAGVVALKPSTGTAVATSGFFQFM